jgi:hypothetical protein
MDKRKKPNGLRFEVETPELELLAQRLYEQTMNGGRELLVMASGLNGRDDMLNWAKAVKAHFDEHQDVLVALRTLNANLIDSLERAEEGE